MEPQEEIDIWGTARASINILGTGEGIRTLAQRVLRAAERWLLEPFRVALSAEEDSIVLWFQSAERSAAVECCETGEIAFMLKKSPRGDYEVGETASDEVSISALITRVKVFLFGSEAAWRERIGSFAGREPSPSDEMREMAVKILQFALSQEMEVYRVVCGADGNIALWFLHRGTLLDEIEVYPGGELVLVLEDGRGADDADITEIANDDASISEALSRIQYRKLAEEGQEAREAIQKIFGPCMKVHPATVNMTVR